jgi:transmembrane sensor
MIVKSGMMETSDVRDAAISWHIRLCDAGVRGEDWAAFNSWLDEDPAHADAYDAVALDDAALGDVIATRAAADNDNPAVAAPRYWGRALFAVVASAAAAVLIIPPLWQPDTFEIIQTRLGEKRDIALPDGSQIALNGDTRIALDRDSNRKARLEAGEALFTIRHDAAHPFIVTTGGVTLKDVGTVFNVRQAEGALDVAVAEGAVAYNPQSAALIINAGHRLRLDNAQAKPVLTKVDAQSVTGWREGRLAYQNALLGEIATDLSRVLGRKVTIAPTLANRRFSGVFRVEGDQTLFFRRLETLLDVHAAPNKDGWQLTS